MAKQQRRALAARALVFDVRDEFVRALMVSCSRLRATGVVRARVCCGGGQRGHVAAAAALLDAGADANFVMPRGKHSTQLMAAGGAQGEVMGASSTRPLQ